MAREKALVLVSDGFPTLCDQRSPADLGRAIADGASAAVPIRTFIIGFATPSVLSSAKFNLINYASMGGTGKPPYLINETVGADAGANQLVEVLLDIAASPHLLSALRGARHASRVTLLLAHAPSCCHDPTGQRFFLPVSVT